MKLEQAIQEYGALLDGQYLEVYKLNQMAKIFRASSYRAKTLEDKDTYYTCYSTCDRLVRYCIEQERSFASIDM